MQGGTLPHLCALNARRYFISCSLLPQPRRPQLRPPPVFRHHLGHFGHRGEQIPRLAGLAGLVPGNTSSPPVYGTPRPMLGFSPRWHPCRPISVLLPHLSARLLFWTFHRRPTCHRALSAFFALSGSWRRIGYGH